jgi:hypothetical protein
MSAIYLEYGGDFVLNQYGGLQLATGWDQVRQALERAILTNPQTDLPGQGPLPPDYLFESAYGSGATREIGQDITADSLAAVVAKVQAAAATIPGIDPTIAPVISIAQSGFQTVLMKVTVTLLDQTQGTTIFAIT